MAVEVSVQSRKRSRDDSDPLSPSSTADLKRQRLDAGSPAVGDSRFGAIASAISGVFGYKRQSVEATEQNGHVDSNHSAYPEPPAPEMAMTSLPSTNGASLPTPTAPTITPAEPLASINTNTAPATTTEQSGNKPTGNTITPATTQPSTASPAPPANRPLGRIEIRLPTMPGTIKGAPAGIKLSALKGTKWDPNPDAGSKKSAKRKPGRPPKVPIKAPIPGGGFNPGIKPISINTADLADQENEAFNSPSGTPTKARPFAYTPKGILTPTKARGIRSSKSVKFDKHGEVFFDDLPRSPLFKSKPAPRKRKQEEEEDDGITCAVCSKPHSNPPNEIILCENCDFAVHQECYDVPEIPEGDWLCKSCAQYDVAKPKPEVLEVVKVEVRTIDRPDIPNLDKHVRSLQRVLLDKCTGRRRLRMVGQEEAAEKVRQLLEQTVLAGEGNSMLLIGPRGSGKTTMVENTITELSREHKHAFHTVRLNGFIHTDDKLALKEIWRQLGKEMQVEDDLLNRSNYADTMASLLALLSHPEEISGVATDGMTSQSVLFVIDEFDMFATHPRQTLLYNLFDIAQSRKAPIAVLGCTTRLDVVETLEKRVKSRFSHRYVYLSLPKTPVAYWHVCKQGLTVTADDAASEGLDAGLEGFAEFIRYWNLKIEDLYTQRTFQDLLQFHYYTSKSPSSFFTEWILPLSTLNLKDLRIKVPTASSPITSLAPPDSKMSLLASLSDLDLALLIAAARLDIVAHTDTVNFAMAYDEYASIVGRQRVQSATSGLLAVGGSVRVWSRGVAGMAWERLISLGLLVPSGIGGGGARRVGGLEGRMWKVDVALEEIPAAVKLSAAMAKWCREI